MTLEDVMERKRCWAELLIGSLWWDSNLPLFLSVHDRASNQQRGSVAKKHVQHINIVLGFAQVCSIRQQAALSPNSQ